MLVPTLRYGFHVKRIREDGTPFFATKLARTNDISGRGAASGLWPSPAGSPGRKNVAKPKREETPQQGHPGQVHR